jgi:hypothetical protein
MALEQSYETCWIFDRILWYGHDLSYRLSKKLKKLDKFLCRSQRNST